jgi:hypothetical protein
VVANFILPMQQQRDVDPEGDVAALSQRTTTGSCWHRDGNELGLPQRTAELPREVARLVYEVRASPAYWINRIKEKTSNALLATFEREVRDEVK